MTIKEIKDLTKFLTDEEVEKIKEEIKNKESVLKSENMDENEMGQVLNTLFAILVIEKTLESEIEGIEDIRAELEQELIESYEIYDSHMVKYKKEEKKKKKKWLLDFLFLSDRVNVQKKNINASTATINRLQKELNTLKQQKSNENLRQVIRDRRGPRFDEFLRSPVECRHPHRHRDSILNQTMRERRFDRLVGQIERGENTRINRLPRRPRPERRPIDRGNRLNNDRITPTIQVRRIQQEESAITIRNKR